MADLNTKQRNELPDSAFAYIDQQGERHLPIPDETHVRNAIQRFGRTHFESQGARQKAAQKVLQAARRHGVELDPDDDICRAAR